MTSFSSPNAYSKQSINCSVLNQHGVVHIFKRSKSASMFLLLLLFFMNFSVHPSFLSLLCFILLLRELLLKNSCSFGFPWIPSGSFGLYGFPWVSKGFLGFLGFPQVFWDPLGFLGFFWVFRVPLGFLGFPWAPLGSLWFVQVFWIPLGYLGFLWVFRVHLLKFK